MEALSISIGCAFIALLNLLLGIFGLKPGRTPASASLSEEVPSSVSPAGKTSD
jgi:hypothetical protein